MVTFRLAGEDGYVLVVALMIMAILSLIGIAGLQTSRFEEEIAGNMWNSRRTFYMADGGISIGAELVEQNLNCAPGFTKFTETNGAWDCITDKICVNGANPYQNADIDPTLPVDDTSGETVAGRIADADAVYPWNGSGAIADQNVNYFYLGGATHVLPGSSLQMAAGYEGKGKSAAQGGVAKVYDVDSQFLGYKTSESIIVAGWRHVIGQEGQCNY